MFIVTVSVIDCWFVPQPITIQHAVTYYPPQVYTASHNPEIDAHCVSLRSTISRCWHVDQSARQARKHVPCHSEPPWDISFLAILKNSAHWRSKGDGALFKFY